MRQKAEVRIPSESGEGSKSPKKTSYDIWTVRNVFEPTTAGLQMPPRWVKDFMATVLEHYLTSSAVHHIL